MEIQVLNPLQQTGRDQKKELDLANLYDMSNLDFHTAVYLL